MNLSITTEIHSSFLQEINVWSATLSITIEFCFSHVQWNSESMTLPSKIHDSISISLHRGQDSLIQWITVRINSSFHHDRFTWFRESIQGISVWHSESVHHYWDSLLSHSGNLIQNFIYNKNESYLILSVTLSILIEIPLLSCSAIRSSLAWQVSVWDGEPFGHHWFMNQITRVIKKTQSFHH